MALEFCMAASVPSGTPWSMASLMAITAACTEDGRGGGMFFVKLDKVENVSYCDKSRKWLIYKR